MKFAGTKDIKYYVKEYFTANSHLFKGRTIVDIPAGTGVSSEHLQHLGADVKAFDLFPELFRVENMTCEEADLSSALPINNSVSDFVLCQEGIEHIPDQLHLLKEFNRILKPSGTLFITTPNYSNLRSKFSYLVGESEFFQKIMPANELDSIWFSEKAKSQIYYGHIFLTGILKLRTLAKLTGFKLKKVHHTRINYTSLFLLPFFYFPIWLFNFLGYKRAMRKRKDIPIARRKEVYRELYKLSISAAILTDCHLFAEFEKEKELHEIKDTLSSLYKEANFVT